MSSTGSLLVAYPPLWVAGMACYPNKPSLVDKFTLQSRFGDIHRLYKLVGDKIMVPRGVCPPGVQDLRVQGMKATFDALNFVPRNEKQSKAVADGIELLQAGQSFVLEAPTGEGKCHGAGTEVLLFDGRLKKVENVVVGDLLMGPDSKPRKVLSTTIGLGPLYKVTPKKGEPFVCNDAHVLSLKMTKFFQGHGNRKGGVQRGGDIVNISLSKYLNKSNSFKHLHKLWRTGVDWGRHGLCLDPYFVGLWLGDGHSKHPAITTADSEIESYLNDFSKAHGLLLRKSMSKNNKSSSYFFQEANGGFNAIRYLLKSSGLMPTTCDTKRIPHTYKTGSKDQRLALLAGLIDSDGHPQHGCCDYVSKSKQLGDDVAFLARSLGLAATVSACKKKSQNGTEGSYYRVSISGDMSDVPVLIERKKVLPRRQKKDVLVSGFSIEPLGEGAYYGFTLDGDHLYLLRDFTVTHNTVCTMPMIAAIGRVTLIVVHKTDLMLQWKKALKEVLGLKDNEIGKIQGDIVDVAGRKVVIGMLQSLSKLDRYPSWVRENFGLVVFDEVHHLAAEVFMRVAGMFPAMLRLGLSATPNRSDRMEVVFFAHIGPVRVRIAKATAPPPKVLRLATGWKCPRKGMGEKMPHAAGKDMHVKKILSKNPIRNSQIVRLTKSAWEKGRCIVVFTDFIEHAHLLKHAFINEGITPHDIGLYIGETKIDQRPLELAKQLVITTFGMMAEGTDKPKLDTCVLTMPRSNIKQAIGRVLRLHEGKQQPVVVDLVDDDSPVFKGYARARLKVYAEIGAEVIAVSV
jgi:hypothetical protein